MKDKVTVDKETGQFFETVFGKDMKAENVEYTDKKEHIIKSMLNDGNTPTGLKIVSSIFGYLITFFTMFVPVSLLVSVFNHVYTNKILDSQIIISVFKILCLSLVLFIILKIIEFLISAFMIWIYSSILTKLSGRSAVLQERIRSHLKTEDAKNGINDENKSQQILNPEDSPYALSMVVHKIVDMIGVGDNCKINVSPKNVETLNKIVMTILFNIYKQGYNGKTEISANDVITGVEDDPSSKYVFEFIMNIIKTSEWFTKPF